MRISAMLVIATLLAPAAGMASDKKHKDAPSHGAIAYSRDSGRFGYAVDRKAARDAKLEALKQCGNEGCEVVASFKSACSALAVASDRPRKPATAGGITRQEAETRALRKCGAGCEVRAWACTK